MTATTWNVDKGDFIAYRGLETMEGAFNVLHIVFTGTDGDEHQVTARDEASIDAFGAYVRVIVAKRRMTAEQAQEIADRAIEVLGGRTPARWFVTIGDERRLRNDAGAQLCPATEIEQGDMVKLEIGRVGEPLQVYELTHDTGVGTIELQLADGPVDGRADAELELLNLEADAP
jgi:hypothetical protein